MTDKDSFIQAFQENIHRAGGGKLLSWIQTTDFFTAPASTRFHGDHVGGLCEHSLNVWYRIQKEANAELSTSNPESLAICGLLHDLCKANFYTVSMRNVKNDKTGKWEKQPFYQVDDQFPYGHGEKSVFLIERFMRLTIEEAASIRWHMGGFDDSARGGSYAVSNAFEKYPLLLCLNVADMKATYFDEKKQEEK